MALESTRGPLKTAMHGLGAAAVEDSISLLLYFHLFSKY